MECGKTAFLLSPVEAMCFSCRVSARLWRDRLTLWPYLSQGSVCTAYHLFTLHSANHSPPQHTHTSVSSLTSSSLSTLQQEKKGCGLPLPPYVAWEGHHILSRWLLISSTGATIKKKHCNWFFLNPEISQLFTKPLLDQIRQLSPVN